MYIHIYLRHFLNSNNLLKSPVSFLIFITIHGLLFLGGGYFVSLSDPAFAIAHSGIGILVYMLFFFTLFPAHFKSALIGSIISVAAGLYFGDFLLSYLYSGVELTFLHKVYGAMLTLYIYLFLDILFSLVCDSIRKKRAQV
jgi:hypothetical protein